MADLGHRPFFARLDKQGSVLLELLELLGVTDPFSLAPTSGARFF